MKHLEPGPDAGTVSVSVGEQGGVVALISAAQPLWLPPPSPPPRPTPPKTVILYVSSAAQIRPAVVRRSQ